MDEEAARSWLLSGLDVPRETFDRLEQIEHLVRTENERQNLVSRNSLAQFWTRHIVDSAQLLLHDRGGRWADLGTGAGFPGLVVGVLRDQPVLLVEQRKLRADFLQRCVTTLGIDDHVKVFCGRVEQLKEPVFDMISARAFAPLDRLFAIGHRFSASTTRWVLPKGQKAKSELEAARASWQGDFRLEPSLTDPEAQIIVAEQVRPRDAGRRKA